MNKCQWALASPLEEDYHDHEWGVPVHDDRLLFEFLILEGAQAGLSWSTILRKRQGYRSAFDNFEASCIADYGIEKIESLLADSTIIRNKLKINAAITNARAFLEVQREFGTFSNYIWQFVNDKPIQNAWKQHSEIPANTPESDLMSRSLKLRGFKFVGTTICYAYMQAIGMVNDHTVDCYRHQELSKVR
ncbi:MAG: DNA-3-methyladenine glycosylase I [Gammaproteobacteria bacterium]